VALPSPRRRRPVRQSLVGVPPPLRSARDFHYYIFFLVSIPVRFYSPASRDQFTSVDRPVSSADRVIVALPSSFAGRVRNRSAFLDRKVIVLFYRFFFISITGFFVISDFVVSIGPLPFEISGVRCRRTTEEKRLANFWR
jgi:hypothetical protein